MAHTPAIEVVQNAFRALNRHDIQALTEMLGGTFRCVDHALGLSYDNSQEFGKYIGAIFRTFPTSQWTLQEILEDAAQFAVQWSWTADIPVVSSHGMQIRSISVPGVSLIRIENGSIHAWVDCYDRLSSGRTAVLDVVKPWVEL